MTQNGYIYLARSDKDIYKIGRVHNREDKIIIRGSNTPYFRVYLMLAVDDVELTEQTILTVFRDEFKHEKGKGYFRGDVNKMIEHIFKVHTEMPLEENRSKISLFHELLERCKISHDEAINRIDADYDRLIDSIDAYLSSNYPNFYYLMHELHKPRINPETIDINHVRNVCRNHVKISEMIENSPITVQIKYPKPPLYRIFFGFDVIPDQPGSDYVFDLMWSGSSDDIVHERKYPNDTQKLYKHKRNCTVCNERIKELLGLENILDRDDINMFKFRFQQTIHPINRLLHNKHYRNWLNSRNEDISEARMFSSLLRYIDSFLVTQHPNIFWMICEKSGLESIYDHRDCVLQIIYDSTGDDLFKFIDLDFKAAKIFVFKTPRNGTEELAEFLSSVYTAANTSKSFEFGKYSPFKPGIIRKYIIDLLWDTLGDWDKGWLELVKFRYDFTLPVECIDRF